MSAESSLLIRTAQPGDEAEIANVHISAWRETYQGLVPDEFLTQMPLTFKRRMESWRKVVQDPAYYVNVSVDNTCVMGFASFSKSRREEFAELGEVQAIYLMQKYQGKGAGYGMLNDGLKVLAQRGFKGAFCWVLESNVTAKFYERSGGKLSSHTRFDDIGRQKVKSISYVWTFT